MTEKIAILASGSGSNAENIIQYFKGDPRLSFPLIICNRREAGIYERARRLGVRCEYCPRAAFENGEVLTLLRDENIDFIVLAGFLLKIPDNLLTAYPDRIINIHPALLPKYGGKGMWGHHVHEAVVAAGEKESGITIHYVNENYDEGAIIFQARCEVRPDDTPDDVAARVHELEYRWFPATIENILFPQN